MSGLSPCLARAYPRPTAGDNCLEILVDFWLTRNSASCMIMKQLNSGPSTVASEGLAMVSETRALASQQKRENPPPSGRRVSGPTLGCTLGGNQERLSLCGIPAEMGDPRPDLLSAGTPNASNAILRATAELCRRASRQAAMDRRGNPLSVVAGWRGKGTAVLLPIHQLACILWVLRVSVVRNRAKQSQLARASQVASAF